MTELQRTDPDAARPGAGLGQARQLLWTRTRRRPGGKMFEQDAALYRMYE